MEHESRQPAPPTRVLVFSVLVLVNWFVSAGVAAKIGGDAIGTRPSIQGFVVEEKGITTAVSERV